MLLKYVFSEMISHLSIIIQHLHDGLALCLSRSLSLCKVLVYKFLSSLDLLVNAGIFSLTQKNYLLKLTPPHTLTHHHASASRWLQCGLIKVINTRCLNTHTHTHTHTHIQIGQVKTSKAPKPIFL